jgi:hypothetical protein
MTTTITLDGTRFAGDVIGGFFASDTGKLFLDKLDDVLTTLYFRGHTDGVNLAEYDARQAQYDAEYHARQAHLCEKSEEVRNGGDC